MSTAVSIPLPNTLPSVLPMTPQPMTAPQADALTDALRQLREAVLGWGPPPPRRTPAPGPAPRPILFGWGEILPAVGRINTAANRRLVRRLNEQEGGPIVLGGNGAQPRADRGELVPWWNGLLEEYQEGRSERADHDRDTAASLADRHGYARAGTVLPGIGGGVKARKRRGPRTAA